MTIESVYTNLLLAKEVFRQVIISSSAIKKTIDTISWENYSTGIFKNLYTQEYEMLVRKRQYTFLLANDMGFIQIYYSFVKGDLKKMKLAYYPYPVSLTDTTNNLENYIDDTDDQIIAEYYYDLWNILSHKFQLTVDDPIVTQMLREAKEKGNYETEESLILSSFEQKYKITNSSHCRIDYDSAVTSHHKCEIQIGAINFIRFPMNKVILPFIFIDFIIKNTFPAEYRSLTSKSNFATDFTVSKKGSVTVDPFVEENIFISHI